MRFRFALLVICCCCGTIITGCGVKRAPVAPEKKAVPVPLQLDCSPTDENCDKTDPNYQPRKR